MKFLRKKSNAVMITMIFIVVAAIFGSGRSLTILKQEVQQVFYDGEQNNGMGIQADIEFIAAQSYNLTVVASRANVDLQLETLIKNVRDYKDSVLNAKTPGQKYEAIQQLITETIELYDYLGLQTLSDKDEEYRVGIMIDINARNLLMARSNYNQLATEFNHSLRKFPANILKNITFVAPLELYE